MRAQSPEIDTFTILLKQKQNLQDQLYQTQKDVSNLFFNSNV